MKKSTILFTDAVTFPTLEITTHADRPIDEYRISLQYGFPKGNQDDLNILRKQFPFTCLLTVYVIGTQLFRNVIFIQPDKGYDPIMIMMQSVEKGPTAAQDTSELEITEWSSESCPYGNGGTAMRFSNGTTRNRTSARIKV